MSPPERKLGIPLRLLAYGSVPLLLVGAGTVGYRALERWAWFDAFYVAVITLTSIGYGERAPVTTGGRVFTLALALGGIFVLAAAVTEVLGTIVSGELREFLGKRRMRKNIEALDQHVIVCGYGHVGEHVCAGLLGGGVSVVAVDRLGARLGVARAAGALAVLGDATADVTLRRAGIERARALVAVAGTDPDNVLITMTARLLRSNLTIVSRAEDDAVIPKLLRAGATRTVSPHASGGRRMAQAVLRPAVLDLLDDATGNGQTDIQIEQQFVRPGSPLEGKTVGASALRSRPGLILVAIRGSDGRLTFNPGDDTPVAAGDTLITLGSV